jgi:hypothetical protein
MRRRPYSAAKNLEPDFGAPFAPSGFLPTGKPSGYNGEWLTAEEAAALLKKFRKKDGKPSVGAIHTMIWRGQLKARKFLGRLMFSRTELETLIALSPQTGG